ncbi:MAG: glutamate--tRNA ligase [Candidatus Nanoarchaeia archaeon]|nr:glutamate--tRNA ligase [Candidatus Haiyanarchaeum thermophilum]MCW1307797.1 glutamate--tRNA ligase [Candidatus Haiyanarchaeum thermophilum]
MNEELESLIRKFALKNAVEHEGKALASAILSKLLGERPEFREKIREVMKIVEKVVREVNSLSLEEQEKELERCAPELLVIRKVKEEKELPELPQAEMGKVVTRLPPEPSGYMHIGHAMSGIINYLYAKKYEGKIWLRFEDTDPRKVRREYYESFIRGYKWLGIKWDFEKYESQHLENYYKYAEKLILKHSAYVCNCPKEKISELRKLGKPCEHTKRSVEENLEEWNRMFSTYREGEAVLRLKGDMESKNYCMRDPVIFRIVEAEHPLVGKKYRIWPTYDFAVSLEDSFCGVTHVLRSAEFGSMRVELQNYIRNLFGMKNPIIIQYSRFNFRGTPIQKRKIRELIKQGIIHSWDDPRLATVDAIRRRGIVPEALRRFTIEVGITQAYHEYEWEMLYAVNRKVLDPITKRYFFVPNPIELEVINAPRKEAILRNHPNRELGVRKIETSGHFFISKDDLDLLRKQKVVRLKYLYNIKVEEINGNKITATFVGEQLKREMLKIQWVTDENVPALVLIPGPLFINHEINKESLQQVRGLCEKACLELQEGDIIQAERFGFLRLDKKENASLTFIFTHR